MPQLVAALGRYAHVDLVPHLGRMNDPVFRAVCSEIADATYELMVKENEKRAR